MKTIKYFLIILITILITSCASTKICKGYVTAKYSIYENNDWSYIVELEKETGGKVYVVETNEKSWRILEIGDHIIMKKYK